MKDYKPTRYIFDGDVDKAKTIVGDGNRLLFQLKNIQQAGAPDIKHLENKYSNGVIVMADTSIYGIDLVRIFVPIAGGEKYDRYRFPVPIISVYIPTDGAWRYLGDNPIGGFSGERFVGRYFEFSEFKKDTLVIDKYKGSDAERIHLSELELVGENWLIESDYEFSYNNSITGISPTEGGSMPPFPDRDCPATTEVPCNGGYCWGDSCCNHSDDECCQVEYGISNDSFLGYPQPATFTYPGIAFGGYIILSFYNSFYGCMNTTTEVVTDVFDIFYGLGNPDSGTWSFEVDGEFTESRRDFTTGPISIDIGGYSASGIGSASGNALDKIETGLTDSQGNPYTTFYCYYHNEGIFDGTSVSVDMSSYWRNNKGVDSYILGIVGERYFNNIKDTSESYYYPGGAAYQYGYTYKWCNIATVRTPEGEWAVHDEGDPVLDTEFDQWHRLTFHSTDIFDYYGTPFYTYCFEAQNSVDVSLGYIKYGMIFKGKHCSLKFPAIFETAFSSHHSFESAVYEDDKGSKKEVTFPKSLEGKYGMGDFYDKLPIFAGKYEVEERGIKTR